MNIRTFLCLVLSLLNLHTSWIIAKGFLLSFTEKFTLSRLRFLKDINTNKWYTKKWAAITGATSGIGLAAAYILAENGVNIVLIGRNVKKGMKAADDIKRRALSHGSFVEVRFLQGDFNSLQSVSKVASDIKKAYPISILINNAGSMMDGFQFTEDGLESVYQTTYVSHFLLTKLLWDTLEAHGPSRIVWVSSDFHRSANTPFLKKNVAQWYSPLDVYSASKLAVVMGCHEFHRRYASKSDGNVTINVVDPGASNTSIPRYLTPIPLPLLNFVLTFFLKPPRKAAESTVFAALHPGMQKKSGRYISAGCYDQLPNQVSFDRGTLEKLWKRTNTKLAPFLIYDKHHSGAGDIYSMPQQWE